MSNIGLIVPMSAAAKVVIAKLGTQTQITKSRIHPISLLLALKTYERGKGIRGSLSWVVNKQILDALDSAFYMAFSNVKSTNKRFLLGVDVSGSMGWDNGGAAVLKPAEAAAALALVTAKTEANHCIMGFSSQFVDLKIGPNDSLADALGKTRNKAFGGTDCALPMIWAEQNKVDVDAFIVYTDNETWFGDIHPTQALKSYRNKTGIAAKLIVEAFTATEFSIADPDDPGMLDIVGLDSFVPTLISDFVSN